MFAQYYLNPSLVAFMMQRTKKCTGKTKTDEGGKNAQVIHDIPFQIFSPKLLPPYTNPLGMPNDMIKQPQQKDPPSYSPPYPASINPY